MSFSTEHMITPTSGWRSRMIRSASSPPMPGICTSSSTRSKAVVRMRCRPSSPEEAIADFIPPFSRMKWMFWRMLGSSSTIRMLASRDISSRLYHRSRREAREEQQRDQGHPGQGLQPRRLEAQEEMEAGQPAGQVDDAVQALPAAEAEPLLPAFGGGDRERQEQRPGGHAEKDELVLGHVADDLVEIQTLIEDGEGEQVERGIEEAEIAQKLADADRPVPAEEDLHRRARQRQHQQHERQVPEVVEQRLDRVGAQPDREVLHDDPEQRHTAGRESERDQRNAAGLRHRPGPHVYEVYTWYTGRRSVHGVHRGWRTSIE